MRNRIQDILSEATEVIQLMTQPAFLDSVHRVGTKLAEGSKNNACIFIAGNGGSWTDADHFAGELRAQFEMQGRPAMPALALPVSLSSVTAWSNDYPDGYKTAMTRDLEALAKPNDIIITISTSGKAQNIRHAMAWAKKHHMVVVAISGNGPQSQEFGSLADNHIIIPSARTARIQEGYQIVIHMLCTYVDQLK